MTTENYDDNVRVITGTEAPQYAERQQHHQRTEQQKRLDQTFADAEEGATAALEHVEDSLAWMETMGDVPAQFRNMPVLLTQWKAWIAEQKRIKQ